jgi:hypothetical protein
MCAEDEQQPTHDSDPMGHVFYWCKNCGLYLINKDMDLYGSELFNAEREARRQKQTRIF